MRKILCPRCWNKIKDCDKCNNAGLIYDAQLTKNFSLGELTDSSTAREKGIANDPTIKEIERLKELTETLLQPCREAMGVIEITSGFRSKALNLAIGGSTSSAHMLGYAADVQPSHCTHESLMHFFKKSKLKFDQIILEFGKREERKDDDWVHIGLKNAAGEQRRQFLVMRNGKYSPWNG